MTSKWPKISMKKAVKYLQNYMQTYPSQLMWEKYSTQVLVDDVLYGLGVAISPNKYRNAEGFARFRADLIAYLQSKQEKRVSE